VNRPISFGVAPEEIPALEAAFTELRDYLRKTIGVVRSETTITFPPAWRRSTKPVSCRRSKLFPDPPVHRRRHGHDPCGARNAARAPAPAQGAMGRGVSRSRARRGTLRAQRGIVRQGVDRRHRRRRLRHSGRTINPFSTMSSTRDESAYVHPDSFDIRRTDQPRLHPIFGSGAHRCIGEALARAELEEALAARIPHIRLDQARCSRTRSHPSDRHHARFLGAVTKLNRSF
jgi:hypothetical protein